MDVFKLIRECPKCNLIWILAEGCNKGACGGVTTVKDVSSKIRYKYNFIVNKDGLTYKVDQDNKPLNASNAPNGPSKEVKRLGCGFVIDFTTNERSKNLEEKLKEFYGVSNYE